MPLDRRAVARRLHVELRAVESDAGADELLDDADEPRVPVELLESREEAMRRLDPPHAGRLRPMPRLQIVHVGVRGDARAPCRGSRSSPGGGSRPAPARARPAPPHTRSRDRTPRRGQRSSGVLPLGLELLGGPSPSKLAPRGDPGQTRGCSQAIGLRTTQKATGQVGHLVTRVEWYGHQVEVVPVLERTGGMRTFRWWGWRGSRAQRDARNGGGKADHVSSLEEIAYLAASASNSGWRCATLGLHLLPLARRRHDQDDPPVRPRRRPRDGSVPERGGRPRSRRRRFHRPGRHQVGEERGRHQRASRAVRGSVEAGARTSCASSGSPGT